jgi:hypothetical protein
MKVAFSSGGLLATSKILPIEKGTLIVTPLLMSKNKNAHPRVFHSGAAILSSLQISPFPLPPLSPSFDRRALRFNCEACAAFSVRPNPSFSSSSSCSVCSLCLDTGFLSGEFFATCASRSIRDVCNARRCAVSVATCCAFVPSLDCSCVRDARLRESDDACLAALAIPSGVETLQHRPAAAAGVRILVENSAPFPMQSQALKATLCETLISCVKCHYRCNNWPVRSASYEFRSDVVVKIMAVGRKSRLQ